MNIFTRRETLRKSNIMNFVQEAKRNYTFNPNFISFTITVPADILKEIEYWSLTESQVSEVLGNISLDGDLELSEMIIIKVNKNDELVKYAKLTYEGMEQGIGLRFNKISIPNELLFNDSIQTTVPVDIPLHFSPEDFENIRKRRSNFFYPDVDTDIDLKNIFR